MSKVEETFDEPGGLLLGNTLAQNISFEDEHYSTHF